MFVTLDESLRCWVLLNAALQAELAVDLDCRLSRANVCVRTHVHTLRACMHALQRTYSHRIGERESKAAPRSEAAAPLVLA